MNLVCFQIITAFQNVSYLFLQKKIDPYIFPSRILSAIESVPNSDRCTDFLKIYNFMIKMEEIQCLNEPIEYFVDQTSKEKGWPYFSLMKTELLKFLEFLCKNTNIPICTKKLRFDFPFLDEIESFCISFLDNQIVKNELISKVESYYQYWQEEISLETKIIIEYFLSTLTIIPFISVSEKDESINKTNDL